MAEMQSQGSLQVCLAGQMTVANMERRNAAVRGHEHRGFRPAAANDQRHQRRQRRQHLGHLPSLNSTRTPIERAIWHPSFC